MLFLSCLLFLPLADGWSHKPTVLDVVLYLTALTFWHRNFILHTLYIKCKNTGPKKGKIME
jgi:hypothetical protein